jgi:hypothetical protein
MGGGLAVSITRYKRRFWAVRDQNNALICICVYKKGAEEVVRRLQAIATSIQEEANADHS